MQRECFEVQILPDARFVLRRDRDGREAEFPSVKAALDYAEKLPGGEEAQMTVLDDQGVRFMKVVV